MLALLLVASALGALLAWSGLGGDLLLGLARRALSAQWQGAAVVHDEPAAPAQTSQPAGSPKPATRLEPTASPKSAARPTPAAPGRATPTLPAPGASPALPRAGAAPVATPPPPPADPRHRVERDAALAQPDPELERLVLGTIQGVPATFSIAVKELSTGRGVLVNPSAEVYAASLFKLAVMYEVFHQRQLGKLRLDETLEVTEKHVEYDLGTLDRGVGDRYSLGQALERMIVISDNASAIMLQDRAGAWRASQSMQALGLSSTFVLADRLTTSARDMLLLFEALARGEALDAESSAAMVHLLLAQRVNDRLPALLPPGTPVAHKTGNWDGNVHDAGIVYAPHATIVVAVLTEGVQDVARTTQAIARLSRVVYDYFVALPTRPLPVPPDPMLSYPKYAPLTPTPVGGPSPADAPEPSGMPAATGVEEATRAPAPRATPTAVPSSKPKPPAAAATPIPPSSRGP